MPRHNGGRHALGRESSSRVLPFTRDDARYWDQRPTDHGVDGLYAEGPKQTQCRVWDMVGRTPTPTARQIAQSEIEREALELRRARRRAQPAPVLTPAVPHPRASRRLLVRVAHQARGRRVA